MKEQTQKRINDNGSYTIKTVKTQTPDDGIVSKRELYSTGRSMHKGKYNFGFGKVVSYTTNDPRITRPFAYGVFGLCILIGIFLILKLGFPGIVIGGCFVFAGIACFIDAKRDIDRIEEELKQKQIPSDPSEVNE